MLSVDLLRWVLLFRGKMQVCSDAFRTKEGPTGHFSYLTRLFDVTRRGERLVLLFYNKLPA